MSGYLNPCSAISDFISKLAKKVFPEMINHLSKSWPDNITLAISQENLQQMYLCSTLDICHGEEWDLSTVGENVFFSFFLFGAQLTLSLTVDY